MELFIRIDYWISDLTLNLLTNLKRGLSPSYPLRTREGREGWEPRWGVVLLGVVWDYVYTFETGKWDFRRWKTDSE